MVYVLIKVNNLLTYEKKGNFNHTTLARNVIIFVADTSFSKHANNKANNI